MAKPTTPTGLTVTFSSSALTLEITGISGIEVGIEKIDVTHYGTTDYREYIFTQLKSAPDITLAVLVDQADLFEEHITTAAPETITITFPTPEGGISGATIVGTGKIMGGTIDPPDVSGVIVGTVIVGFDGFTGPTWTEST